MQLINKESVAGRRSELVAAMRAGKIFIYPTDTIYGIGCDATSVESIAKIRSLKHRPTKPFSVIAPSKDWIIQNCVVANELILEKLPGPFTLIFSLRNTDVIARSINPDLSTLGVRIPTHWFSELVAEAGVPFVTTSVNVTDEKYMKRFTDLSDEFKNGVDYILYDGELKGVPSKKLNFADGNH